MRSKGKCERWGEPLKGLNLHLHHKDGNPKNNKLSTFEVLCPNCHSRTRTEKKSNKIRWQKLQTRVVNFREIRG